MSKIKKASPEELLEYCKSNSQRKTIEALIEHGSNTKAADALGVDRRTVDKCVVRVRTYKNVHHSDGFNVKGKSTLYDADGEVKIEWVKTERDKESNDLLIESITDIFESYKGVVKGVRTPKAVNENLLTFYPMGDPHIGLYAWAEECGDDFDCDIAERDLVQAVTSLVELSPASHTAIIGNLGDFFHADSHSNTTTKGTPVDVDGRWSRVLGIGVRIMIQCIELALQKHKLVIVKNAIGNHDTHTSQVLAIALSCFFSGNKRVQIDVSPAKFWYYKFGKCMFGITHGDTAKPDKLANIMAVDRPEDWGATRYRYFHTGHIHHDNVKDFVGIRWESHRTLAAKDSWHSAMGYRSQRDMKAITYHKDYGEDSRFTMSLARLRNEL